MKYFVTIGETTHEVEVTERLGELEVSIGGEPFELSYAEADSLGQVLVLHEGQSYGFSVEGDENRVHLTLAGHVYSAAIEDERERAAQLAAKAARGGGGPVNAVMPGVVVELLVAEGDTVEEGQPLLILEAMKMQNEIGAPAAGIVQSLHVAAGTAVGAGDKLVTLGALPEEE